MGFDLDNLFRAIGVLLIILLTILPFGVWKVGEIVYWLITHIHVSF